MSRLPRPSFGVLTVAALLILLGAYLALVEASRPDLGGDRLRLDQLITLAEQDRIREATILDQDSYVVGSYEAEDGTVREFSVPYLRAQALKDSLLQIMTTNQAPLKVDQQFGKSLVQPASILIPALMVSIVFIYFIVSYRRGTGIFGVGSGARRVKAEESRATFADVAGQSAAVSELSEVTDYLSDPERFAKVGARIPRGILLYGPPGCGKTLMARALAGESGASFLSISGSDFVELYVGVGAARVRDLFREARENAPAIIFIDELDALGRRRGAGDAPSGGSTQEQEQALNQVLVAMDGFSPADGVIVVGATNRPDVLDPALLRPGRFDRAISLERVDEGGRREILELHASGKPLADDVDLAAIAHDAVGMTGADLATIVNEAGLLAARNGSTEITQEQLEAALSRVKDEPERQRRLAARGRTLGQRSLAEEKITFADIAGVDDAVTELAEVKHFLTEPERFEAIGARIPRGYMLIGPPGTGKTMLARAVAGEANAAFVSVAGSEFTEVFVGEGSARVRDLFAEARALAPAIVFIDEIDAIGAHRGGGADGHREREQTLNQILIELDGFSHRAGVIALAATNRPDILDPALVRPGRFDRTVTIGLPDREGREAILRVHAKGKRLANDVDLARIAGLTRGLSGADLANVLNEAALLAARAGQPAIPMAMVEDGVERVMQGVSGRRALSDEERRRIAYHEAGHALIARALPNEDTPHRVTIASRGSSLGQVTRFQLTDQLTYSRAALEDELAALLSGRIAEQVVFGDASSGGMDDLGRANDIARAMVRDLGMSRLGIVTYDRNVNGEGRISPETAAAVDEEARRLLNEASERCRTYLKANRKLLDQVADELLERETLSADQLEEILSSATAQA